jgi:deoxyribonuclease IV
MPRLGAHVSIGGGLPRAVDRAAALGCDAMQIFTKPARQWTARPLRAAEVAELKRKSKASGITPVFAHDSYLINLASSDVVLRSRSIAAFGEEMDRAEALGLSGLVMHPGSCATGSEEDGLRLVVEALEEVLSTRRRGKTMILLEHTAGQGNSLGYRFEHLAWIIRRLRGSRRVGVCLDTCHLLAAGYDIASSEGYEETFRAFDEIVGLKRLKLFHLNDSKKPCRSRVDRHEHIGRGCIGLEAFARLLRDPRFADMAMLLETPKSPSKRTSVDVADPLDRMNLATLRRLLA